MALRRQVRMRKEYIYRKSLQGKEAAVYEDKKRVREALRDGTPLPTELRADEEMLRHEVGVALVSPANCGSVSPALVGLLSQRSNLKGASQQTRVEQQRQHPCVFLRTELVRYRYLVILAEPSTT